MFLNFESVLPMMFESALVEVTDITAMNNNGCTIFIRSNHTQSLHKFQATTIAS